MRLLVVIFFLFLLPCKNALAQSFSCDQAKYLLSDLRLGESYEDYFIRKGFDPDFSSQATATKQMEGIVRGMFPGWLCSPGMVDVDTGGFDELTCLYQFSEGPGTEEQIINAAEIFQSNISKIYSCFENEVENTLPESMSNPSRGEALITVLSTESIPLSPQQVYNINSSNERLGLTLLDRSLKYSLKPTMKYGYKQHPKMPLVMELTAKYTINPDVDSALKNGEVCSVPEQILTSVSKRDSSKILKSPNHSSSAKVIFGANNCSLYQRDGRFEYSCNWYDESIDQVYDKLSECFSYYAWSNRYNDDGFKSYYTRRNSKNVRLSVRETESSYRGEYVRLSIAKR